MGFESYWKRRELKRQNQLARRTHNREKTRGFSKLRKSTPYESVTRRIVNFSTCLLFILSSRSIFYRASNQRATTELPPAAVSVNLPSKPPRTSVNVFSRVSRIHETVPTSMSRRVTNYWRCSAVGGT